MSFPFVHNRHSPCEHSLQRLFTTTPIGCEHSARHLCTRREAVVYKWWGGPVFGVCGEMMQMYKYAIAVYLCKNRGSENAVFGTRLLFGWEYAIFDLVSVCYWLLVWCACWFCVCIGWMYSVGGLMCSTVFFWIFTVRIRDSVQSCHNMISDTDIV